MTTNMQHRPLVLIILDGFGYRKTAKANAIKSAHMPTWDYLCHTYPNTLISGSGKCVGLPDGQMGNSEVGHMNMGAGRIVHQDLTRIDEDIDQGTFSKNQVLSQALDAAKKSGKAIHLLGLLSPGGVHSHERHWQAIIQLAAQKQVPLLYLHPFTDGRDTPPESALASLSTLQTLCDSLNCGTYASLIGRYYAMDRDNRFERIQKAYELLVDGKADFHANDIKVALSNAYARGETDEFIQATAIHPDNQAPYTINDGDIVLFLNFRADRARELTQSFINPNFNGFKRVRVPTLSMYLTMTEYDKRFPTPVIYPPIPLTNMFAEVISKANLKQLRIAETEKYAHVTFFFNGGIEIPYPLEDRVLIPSPKVATYDLQPEMSAPLLTERLVSEIKSKKYDVIICNFANPDMLGHTGNFAATVSAMETIDDCLQLIIKALEEVGGEAIITADHGNAEMMFDDKTNQPHTAHTSDPVPFLYFGRNAMIVKENGKLSDIAPTMLYLMKLSQPMEMTGNSLLKLV